MPEEARPFRRLAGTQQGLRILATGMGAHNATQTLRRELETGPSPGCVLTCGFAGGLNPELPGGLVLVEAAEDCPLRQALLNAGARPATFHCADRVATTVGEKSALRQTTGCDAVEMESAIIQTLCRERGIPVATVRVISDVANEDLPLDFNALMTPEMRIDPWKLAGKIIASPGKIAALLRLRTQVNAAAEALAHVLVKALAAGRSPAH